MEALFVSQPEAGMSGLDVLRKTAGTLPLTSLVSASLVGFLMVEIVAPSSVAIVLFYLLALPYYVTALVASGLAHAMGIHAGWPVVIALGLVADLVVVAPLRRSARAGRRDQ